MSAFDFHFSRSQSATTKDTRRHLKIVRPALLAANITLPLGKLILPDVAAGIAFLDVVEGSFLSFLIGAKSRSLGQKHNGRNDQQDRNQPHQYHDQATTKHS